MGQVIVRFEGRYRGGNLQVYDLPKDDAGSSFEAARINNVITPKCLASCAP
jgi:hypothetical protein